MSSVEDILNELEKKTKISREELKKRIVQKQEELSGLVSLEGAAYLVARELGINLLEEVRRKLEIKNIVPGMRNVNTIGRVFKILNIVEFKRADGSDGRVANFYLGDSSGCVRIVLWDKQVSLIEEGAVKLGDVIQVFNGLAKENVFGEIEVTLGKYGGVRSVEDSFDLPSLEELNRSFIFAPQKADIANISPGGVFEVRGNIVQVFKTSFIFRICPVCGVGLREIEGKFRCAEHGEVESKPELVINSIIDDGTGSMRVVFFRDLAEKISGISASELAGLEEGERYEHIKEKLMGKELIIIGRVKRNKRFDRLELIGNSCKDLNVLEESKELAKEIELKLGNFTTVVS
ncbi:MAG: DUF2240 family protein [Candidatus Aenigmarchaeota archaeon]|nr:DUF2240 family protein [Candidatus Aenigmarchaeota archaeon]